MSTKADQRSFHKSCRLLLFTPVLSRFSSPLLRFRSQILYLIHWFRNFDKVFRNLSWQIASFETVNARFFLFLLSFEASRRTNLDKYPFFRADLQDFRPEQVRVRVKSIIECKLPLGKWFSLLRETQRWRRGIYSAQTPAFIGEAEPPAKMLPLFAALWLSLRDDKRELLSRYTLACRTFCMFCSSLFQFTPSYGLKSPDIFISFLPISYGLVMK